MTAWRDCVLRRDFHRMRRALANGSGLVPSLQFALTSSELHCIAAYRLGRAAERLRSRRSIIGLPLTVLHRVWDRWNTHLHHCAISRHAQIGGGFLLMHRNGVLIGPVTIGDNVVVHHNVTIGQRVARGSHGLPTIGEDVWIGPGAIITGDIVIGDGATISAGSVVSRDVPAQSLVAGNPGRVIARDYDHRALMSFAQGPID